MRYMMVVLLEFYPSWLALSREERRKHAGLLQGIVNRYRQQVQVRYFDAEALPGREYTDFVVCETDDMRYYHYMWEEIRDSAPYTNGHMKIKDVVMGLEQAFQSYESDMLKLDD